VSNTKKPRRAYDPKRLERQLVGNAVSRARKAKREAEYRAGMMNLSDDALRDLGVAYHMALSLMRQYGGEDHFHTLAAAINIAGRFCEMGIGAEYAGEIEAAIAALNRVRLRAQRLGKWALDGEGLTQVARALEIHDAQMQSVTYNELRASIVEVFRRNEAQNAPAALAA
jgi:hypothetical protein